MLFKSILKLASSFVSIILISGLLTSCGASKEELALKANCDRIFANLLAIGDRPEVFRNSEVADGDSVSLLLGEETRKDVERKILAKFPFLDDIIVGREKGKQQVDLSYYYGSIFLIADAIKGTDIKFPYSREEMFSMVTREDGSRDVVDALATEIFGDYVDSGKDIGCNSIDNLRVESNRDDYSIDYSDNFTSVAFSRASDDYLDFAEFLQAIRDCEVSGWHVTNKCAKVDYVSKPSSYVPSNELTEEEKEILAEREADAGREAQNPSSSGQTSNVTPGQICNNFGAVVQTENYGSLTCKLVWLNKVKAFVWMRS